MTARVDPDSAVAASSRWGRLPGLDGLRGLAVTAVVLFHLWPDAVPGGFLGVSLFFTLSGYLITTLLVTERERSGRISLQRFWGRRLRRLLPASLLVLLAVLVIWAVTGWLTDAVRRDVLWAALDVANWQHIVTGAAYGVSPESSPVLHFWSLSIEEQCYLLLPLVVVACGTRRRLGTALAALLALSATLTLLWSGDRVVTYFSTLTRAGELLAGALAAVVVGRSSAAASAIRRAPRTATMVGLTGLAVLAFLALRTSLDTEAYARGGLLGIGALSAITIVTIVEAPWVSRHLDRAALAWLGSVSYGIYLIHWPVLVALRNAGIHGSVIPWLTLGLTLPLAWASARFVELPIRHGRLAPRPLGVALSGAFLTLGMAIVLVEPQPRPGVVELEAASRLADERLAEVRADLDDEPAAAGAGEPAAADPGATPPSSAPASAAPDPGPLQQPASVAAPPVRYGWFGDSKALPLVLGIPAVDRAVPVTWVTQMGCPVGRSGSVRSRTTGSAVWTTDEKGCDWTTSVPAAMPPDGLDVALVDFGTWDVAERRVDDIGEGWTSIGDPAYDAWLVGEMQAMTDLLVGSGARVVAWMTVVPDEGHGPTDRFERFNHLVGELAAANPDTVRVVDFAGWIAATGEQDRLLPDGAHATFEPNGGTAAEIAERFLYDQIVAASSSVGSLRSSRASSFEPADGRRPASR